jgi:hypothetical protein
VGRHLDLQSGTGGSPSTRSGPLLSSERPDQGALGAAFRALRRTSVVGDVALGFDERALPGAVRRSENGNCRGGPSSGRFDLGYGYLVQPRHVPV